MKRRWPASVALLLALGFGAGCDTDAPLQIEDLDTDVEILAVGAVVEQFFTWRLTEDSGGVPGDASLWCQLDPGPGLPFSAPWNFAIEIKVLRADTMTEEILTSTDAFQPNFNRAMYDSGIGFHSRSLPATIQLTHPRGACAGNPLIKCNPNSTSGFCLQNNAGACVSEFSCTQDFDTLCDPANSGTVCSDAGAGVCTQNGFCSRDPGMLCDPSCGELGLGSCINDTQIRTFNFDNTPPGRLRLTAANRTLLEAEPNIINGACAGDPVCEAQLAIQIGTLPPTLGVCPGDPVGEPEIDPGNPLDLSSNPVKFGLILNKGDTLVVQSRRSDTLPGGGIPYTTLPGIRAVVNVGGIQLQAGEVEGNRASGAGDPSPNISFSFTSQ